MTVFLLVLLSGCTLPRVIVLSDPLDAAQHNDLGVAYEARGEFDLAERAYRRAAELDGDWALPLVNLGNVLAATGDEQGAARAYRQALRRQPDEVAAMNNLAWVLLGRGDSDEALHWARRAVNEAPGELACWETLAQVHARRGEAAAAHEALEMALLLAADDVARARVQSLRERIDASN